MTTYNNELEVIDTKEKAYLLGFIYSDGCIGNYNGSYCVCITQHVKDENLMSTILELFPFFKEVKDSSKPTQIIYRCDSKKLYTDLLSNGVLPQKSDNNRFNLRFPHISTELYSSFIRGYFDGDGSVYKQKQGNTRFEIGGTCFYLITDIIKILYDNGITVNLRCRYTGEGNRTMDFYVLYASSDKISKKFAEYIYSDCGNLFMKRKHDKLFFIPEYHTREKLICPICGRNNTIRGGQRQMIHGLMLRGYCKDCKKQFSITAPTNSNISSGEDELLED